MKTANAYSTPNRHILAKTVAYCIRAICQKWTFMDDLIHIWPVDGANFKNEQAQHAIPVRLSSLLRLQPACMLRAGLACFYC
ncbi:MAG: hypothetical protein Q7T62_02880 [Undibacterium sp.]|nr:hypothetical protein [Undibacterium sp.]